jgi:hypothetical protein
MMEFTFPDLSFLRYVNALQNSLLIFYITFFYPFCSFLITLPMYLLHCKLGASLQWYPLTHVSPAFPVSSSDEITTLLTPQNDCTVGLEDDYKWWLSKNSEGSCHRVSLHWNWVKQRNQSLEHRNSQMFQTIGSPITAKLPAVHVGALYPQKGSLYSFFVRG